MTVILDTRARRAADIGLGVAGLIVMALPMTAIAGLIRLTSPGPAIFRQERIGVDQELFIIYKFRTMRAGSHRGPSVSGDVDNRVTPVGRFLRARRLDELPQLISLVRGDMTLIGPRPEVPKFLAHYTKAEFETLAVRPGIIGPGSVLFADKLAADLDDLDEPEKYYIDHQLHPRLECDLSYLRHRSIRDDIRLLLAALGVAGGAR